MRVIVALIAVALAAAIFFLWPRSEDNPPDGTQAAGTTTTTGAEPATTTTTDTPTTQPTPTTTVDSHVVESVEEAEEILREHYSTWFRGIYEEDPEPIRDSVILQSQVDAAIEQFGEMSFDSPPTREGLIFENVEVMLASQDCLSVWARVTATFREGSSEGVVVFRWQGNRWRFLSSWSNRNDLWEADCESSL